MQDFRKLRVWHLAHRHAVDVTRVMRGRVGRAAPGLRGQSSRAALSIGSNIAEGCGKHTPREFHRFLEQALSSLLELESQLLFARDAGAMPLRIHDHLDQRSATLRRMLISLMRKVLASSGAKPGSTRTRQQPRRRKRRT